MLNLSSSFKGVAKATRAVKLLTLKSFALQVYNAVLATRINVFRYDFKPCVLVLPRIYALELT